MKLPKVLIKKTLEREHSCQTYRLVAIETTIHGFEGVDYLTEKLAGIDAMGVERWVPTEFTEGSLVIAAIGQSLLENLR